MNMLMSINIEESRPEQSQSSLSLSAVFEELKIMEMPCKCALYSLLALDFLYILLYQFIYFSNVSTLAYSILREKEREGAPLLV